MIASSRRAVGVARASSLRDQPWSPRSCADAWDEARGRYKGLRRGGSPIVQVTNETLIVKPSAAARQDASDSGTFTLVGPDGVAPAPGAGDRGTLPAVTPATARVTLFVASAVLDPLRIGRDAGRIAEEVIQHLSALPGADANVTLEVQIRVPDGVDDSLIRIISENCRTLGFKSHAFEE